MEIIVAEKIVPNWQFGGSQTRLRLILNQRMVTSDNKILMQGNLRDQLWYRDIVCEIDGDKNVTIPEFVIDSTIDSSNPSATCTAIFFDSTGRNHLSDFLTNFKVPTSYGAEITWQQLFDYRDLKQVSQLSAHHLLDNLLELIGARIAADSIGEANGIAPLNGSAVIDVSTYVAANAIDFNRIQQIATARILGRKSAGTGNVEALTLSEMLDLVGGAAAAGDIFIRTSGGWVRLAKGVDGQVLKLDAGLPAWRTESGGGGGSGSQTFSSGGNFTFQ